MICSTWSFGHMAVQAGGAVLEQGGSALDAVEAAVNKIELDTQACTLQHT